jgi:anti-sigma B factor antagonist
MGSPGPPRFEIAESVDGDGPVVLVLSGELDLATAPVLEEKLDAARRSEAPVTVDLRPLRFMDSSGLRVLLAAALQARESSWTFAVIPGEGPVRRIFETAGVDHLVPFVDPA